MNRAASALSFTGVAAVNRFAERCSGNPDSRLGLGRFGAMTPIATQALGTTSRPVAEHAADFPQSKSPPRRGIWAGCLTLSGGRQRGGWGPRFHPFYGRVLGVQGRARTGGEPTIAIPGDGEVTGVTKWRIF